MSEDAALYAAETIGYCEWCGRLDHHLVAGECPRCRVLVDTVAPSPAPADVADAQEVAGR